MMLNYNPLDAGGQAVLQENNACRSGSSPPEVSLCFDLKFQIAL